MTKCSDIAMFIEGIIDDFVITRKKPKANFTQFLKSEQIDRRTINEFVSGNLKFIQDQIDELDLVLENQDPVAKEGYSHFRRPEIRDYRDMLSQIIDDLYSYKDTKKIVRKRKRVSVDKLLKYISFYDEDYDLDGMIYKSQPKENILGAKHIFLYNFEKRELTYYTGRSLGIRRTVITDFDENKSWVRTIRKPEEFLPNVIAASKFNAESIGTNLSTKAKAPTGRTSSKQILLKIIT